jgi:hypothetical protein
VRKRWSSRRFSGRPIGLVIVGTDMSVMVGTP